MAFNVFRSFHLSLNQSKVKQLNYFAIVLLSLTWQLSAQTRVYVTPNGSGTANGSSWNNALPGNQIQNAINGFSSGGEVWIAAGTYLPTETYDNGAIVRRAAFTLRSDVHLYGGFSGAETDTAQRSDFGEGGLNETILSGDIGIPGDSTDNAFHVIWGPSGISNARVDGFIIRDGVANGGNFNDRSGGGIHINAGTIISKCVIKNNYGESAGGGVFIRSNNEMHQCVIKENHCDDRGGGVYFSHFNLSSNVEPIAENCLFFRNTCNSEGGGAHLRSGGQVYNSRFIGNQAVRGGGAYMFNQGDIINCIASNNRANITGGGFHITGGNIINTTIVRNQAGTNNGGGVYRSGTGLVQNSVLWGNSHQFNYLGSGIAIEHSAMQPGHNIPAGGLGSGVITISNQNAGTDPAVFYPNFVDPTTVIGNNPGNPSILLFANWNITCESAMIDGGDSALVPAGFISDFAGNLRFVDGNGDGSAQPDLGAFEYTTTLSDSVAICPGDTIMLGGQIITSSGIYNDTIPGSGNCDSIIQLVVNVLAADSAFFLEHICEGDVFTFRGQDFSSSGTYILTSPSASGCDSILQLTLNVAPVDTVQLADTTVFDGQNATFFQIPIDSSGKYSFTEQSTNGCDSIIKQNITLLDVDSVLNETFCAGNSFSFQGSQLDSAGDYFFILADSTVLKLSLSEDGGDTTDLGNVFISQGTNYNFFGTNISTPGTYYHTTTTSKGCDSVLQISLFYRKYVTITGAGAQNGNSWSSAYSASQLQSGIDGLASSGGGQVWVAKGVYKPGNLRSNNFFLRTGIELIGGFEGNETDTAQRSDYGLNGTNQTVLSGDIGIVGDSTDNTYYVIIQNTNGYAMIDGFVIRDAQGIGFSAEGAGVVIRPGGVLRNSVVYNNYGEYKGGGMFANGALVEYTSFIGNRANSYGGAALARNATFRHCYFENNRSGTGGGALQLELEDVIVDSCVFESNQVEGYGWGGAISIDGSMNAARVRNSTFNNNSAVLGGAVHNLNIAASFRYENCVFTNNHAPNFVSPVSGNTSLGTGGAMLITNSEAVNCTFSNNSAARGGAVWVGKDGVVDSCTFNNNTSSNRGGSIYGWDSGLVKNSSINGGQAPEGGGMFLEGTSRVEHSIIQNTFSPLGGGVLVEANASVNHCIITGCHSPAGGGALIRSGGLIYDCDIFNNTASNGGGVTIRANGGPVINSRIYNNGANTNGGGAFLALSSTSGGELINTNIYNNHAGQDGGGVYHNFGGHTINTNVSRNSADRNGGGVFINFRGNVRNSIIWGNSTQIATSTSGTAISVDTSAVQGGYAGRGVGNLIIDIDTNNAGTDTLNYVRFNQPTTFVGRPSSPTHTLEMAQSDWNLLCGSAAIDAANNLTVPDTITQDLLGNDRFLAGNGSNAIVDLGPIEANFNYFASEALCIGDTFILGNQTITEDGSYTFTGTSALGCDSTLTVEVAFLPIDTNTIVVTACESEGYVFGEDTLFVPGQYFASFASDNFCDSVVELHLNIVNVFNTLTQANICEGDSFIFRGQTLAQAGLYSDTLQAANGCDSIVSLQLDVTLPDTSQMFLSGCGSLTYEGVIYSTSGVYLLQYPSVATCDSFVELVVTILSEYRDTIAVSSCESFTFNNQVYNSSGFYSETFTSTQNCDSTIVLDLTILENDSSAFSMTACSAYDFNGQLLTQSGNYTDTLTNVNGCDSIVTLTLTIEQPTSSTQTVSACASFDFNGQLLTQSGVYTDTLQAVNGCDSVVNLNLTILPISSGSLTISACNSYDFNGQLLTQSGLYNDTLQAANGCDSIVTLNLTISQPVSNTISITACESFDFNSQILDQSGTYNDTLVAANGCDSIVTLNLTIEQATSSTQSITACDVFIFNGQTLTQSGTFVDTLSTVNGCDSVVTINLTINTIDRTVTNNDPVLTANAVGVTYQWVDCSNDSILPGETSQNFTATSNGQYAVILSDGVCTDTSNCYNVNTVSVWSGSLNNLLLYPNPTVGNITLTGEALIGASIRLLDMRGGQIFAAIDLDIAEWNRDLSQLAAGTYMVEVTREGERKVFMVVRL